MPSLLPGYEYDIFISYRHNDNRSGWVTKFVKALQGELAATIKDPISIYFDTNPHDGLLETHSVDKSLENKLKCLIFIPILSQTYCDPKSFAWQHEFQAFIQAASRDTLGMNVTLPSRNVAQRVLPVQIHDLETEDLERIAAVLPGPLRAIPMIYRSAGVNRPLRAVEDHPQDNLAKTYYRDQINKVANAVKEVAASLKNPSSAPHPTPNTQHPIPKSPRNKKILGVVAALLVIISLVVFYFYFGRSKASIIAAAKSSIGVIPLRNNTGDKNKTHYGVGIASEVSTQLGLSGEFDFISSLQATIQYQQSDKPPTVIGNELGVTHILSGIYQTAGDNIQVLVELIDAVTGKVEWSLTYRTHYDDIFQVQSNIASKVMDKFSLEWSSKTKAPTQNLEAYTHYVRGIEISSKTNIPEERFKSILEFQQAIELDSGFIGPWGELILNYSYYYFNQDPAQVALSSEMIIPYVEYVEKQFPDSWEKKTIRGVYTYYILKEYGNALNFLQGALKENPEAQTANALAAAILRRKLNLTEAFNYISKAIKQHPTAPLYWNELQLIITLMGDYETAEQAAQTVYQFNNKLQDALYDLKQNTNALDKLPKQIKQDYGKTFQSDLLLQQRDFEGLLSYTDTLSLDSTFNAQSKSYYRAVAFYLSKRDKEAKSAARQFLVNHESTPRSYQMASIMGDKNSSDAMIQSLWSNFSEEEDIMVQLFRKEDLLTSYALRGDYARAEELLRQLNKDYPAIGDYNWLNLPLYDRIKSEYPPFAATIKQLKLPPKLSDTSILRM